MRVKKKLRELKSCPCGRMECSDTLLRPDVEKILRMIYASMPDIRRRLIDVALNEYGIKVEIQTVSNKYERIIDNV